MKIGFIGIGVMGNGMVQNLLKHGYSVNVYSRTKAKADEVVKAGAVWCDTIAECVAGAETVITMVGYPKDVEEVYLSDAGILKSAVPGTVVIDMTTTSPQLSRRIYEEAKKYAIPALDAPVSGGDTGARAGTLAIMVGGDELVFEKCRPIFQAMGTNIIYEGKAGAGQHTKMANQIALGGAIAGVCEAMTYAKKVGLDLQTMLDSISKGAAGSWQMSNMAPKMLKGDFTPGFFMKHFVKDMSIATEEAGRMDIDLPVLGTVLSMYQFLEAEGYGDEGTQALIRAYLDPQ